MPLRLGGGRLDGWTPAQHARACADATALLRGKPFAVITYEVDSVHMSATVLYYTAQHGLGLAAAPKVACAGTGVSYVLWSSAYTDDYGVTTPTHIRHARAVQAQAGGGLCVADVVGPTKVYVRTWNAGGGALFDRPVTLVVR
jgi:hypothetical protein